MKLLSALIMALSFQSMAIGNPTHTPDENHLPETELQQEEERLDAEASEYEGDMIQEQQSRTNTFEDEGSQIMDPEYDVSEEGMIPEEEVFE